MSPLLTTTLIAMIWCVASTNAVHCVPGARFAHPRSCSDFILCDAELKWKTFSCPKGLHFNILNSNCGWPKDANCSRDGTTPDKAGEIVHKPNSGSEVRNVTFARKDTSVFATTLENKTSESEPLAKSKPRSKGGLIDLTSIDVGVDKYNDTDISFVVYEVITDAFKHKTEESNNTEPLASSRPKISIEQLDENDGRDESEENVNIQENPKIRDSTKNKPGSAKLLTSGKPNTSKEHLDKIDSKYKSEEKVNNMEKQNVSGSIENKPRYAKLLISREPELSNEQLKKDGKGKSEGNPASIKTIHSISKRQATEHTVMVRKSKEVIKSESDEEVLEKSMEKPDLAEEKYKTSLEDKSFDFQKKETLASKMRKQYIELVKRHFSDQKKLYTDDNSKGENTDSNNFQPFPLPEGLFATKHDFETFGYEILPANYTEIETHSDDAPLTASAP